MPKVKTGHINLPFWENLMPFSAKDEKTSSCYVVPRLKEAALSKTKHFARQVGAELERWRSSPVPVYHSWLSNGTGHSGTENYEGVKINGLKCQQVARRKLKTRIMAYSLGGKPGLHAYRKRRGAVQCRSIIALETLAQISWLFKRN